MHYPDDDTLLGLEQAKKGRKPRRWSGSLPQRIRASKRLPQAVFKISSYSRSGGAVWDRVHYISREGELAVEDANGQQLADLAELEEMVGEWEERQGKRATRLAMSAVASFPAGVDQEKATAAARQFFQAAFADTYDYVFAPHADTDQFHVHLLLETRGHDGQLLRLDRAALHDLRLLLAEQARAQGIELDASPRWARGEVAWEPAPPRARAAAAGQEAAAALAAEQATHRDSAEPEYPCQALEYARAAATLTAQIPRLAHDQQKRAVVQGAVQLAEFGWALSEQSKDSAEDLAEAHAVIRAFYVRL